MNIPDIKYLDIIKYDIPKKQHTFISVVKQLYEDNTCELLTDLYASGDASRQTGESGVDLNHCTNIEVLGSIEDYLKKDFPELYL